MAVAYVPKRRYKGMGLLGLGQTVPTRIWGTEQCAAFAAPERCDHCGSRVFEDRVELRRFYCWGCSRDWFLVRS